MSSTSSASAGSSFWRRCRFSPGFFPGLGDFLKAISPYVQSVKLGGLQVDLRVVGREAISVPSHGILASVPNDVAALSSGTAIQELVYAFREFRRKGAGPVVVIDLQDGRKWRLPNLYFLTRLLETEPVVSELVFTEMHGGSDGYVVGAVAPTTFGAKWSSWCPATEARRPS